MCVWLRCVTVPWSQVIRRRRAEKDLSEQAVDTGKQRHVWISFSTSVKSRRLCACWTVLNTNWASALTEWNACCGVRPLSILRISVHLQKLKVTQVSIWNKSESSSTFSLFAALDMLARSNLCSISKVIKSTVSNNSCYHFDSPLSAKSSNTVVLLLPSVHL